MPLQTPLDLAGPGMPALPALTEKRNDVDVE